MYLGKVNQCSATFFKGICQCWLPGNEPRFQINSLDMRSQMYVGGRTIKRIKRLKMVGIEDRADTVLYNEYPPN